MRELVCYIPIMIILLPLARVKLVDIQDRDSLINMMDRMTHNPHVESIYKTPLLCSVRTSISITGKDRLGVPWGREDPSSCCWKICCFPSAAPLQKSPFSAVSLCFHEEMHLLALYVWLMWPRVWDWHWTPRARAKFDLVHHHAVRWFSLWKKGNYKYTYKGVQTLGSVKRLETKCYINWIEFLPDHLTGCLNS